MAKYIFVHHMCIVSCFGDDVIKMLLNGNSFYNTPLRSDNKANKVKVKMSLTAFARA